MEMAEPDSEKNARPRHYTPVEREIFLELLTQYRDVIENKKSDNVSLKKQEEAWKKVETTYNASHLITQQRTVAQLEKWWSNLKQHQRDAKTTEMQKRLKTGGGPPVSVADIVPQIEVIAPHLMVNAPTLLTSNMNNVEHDTAIANISISNTKFVVDRESPVSNLGTGSENETSQTDGSERHTQIVPFLVAEKKRKRSPLSSLSQSSSGDDSSAKCERIRRINDTEEEVHRANFSIELQTLQGKRSHCKKLQELIELEAAGRAREAQMRADEAAQRVREAKAKADLPELQLKRSKEEDEMF